MKISLLLKVRGNDKLISKKKSCETLFLLHSDNFLLNDAHNRVHFHQIGQLGGAGGGWLFKKKFFLLLFPKKPVGGGGGETKRGGEGVPNWTHQPNPPLTPLEGSNFVPL